MAVYHQLRAYSVLKKSFSKETREVCVRHKTRGNHVAIDTKTIQLRFIRLFVHSDQVLSHKMKANKFLLSQFVTFDHLLFS